MGWDSITGWNSIPNRVCRAYEQTIIPGILASEDDDWKITEGAKIATRAFLDPACDLPTLYTAIMRGELTKVAWTAWRSDGFENKNVLIYPPAECYLTQPEE